MPSYWEITATAMRSTKLGISAVATAAIFSGAMICTPAHANLFKVIEKAVRDGGVAVEKGVRDGGVAIEKGVRDGGVAIEKGVRDGGVAIEKGVRDGGVAVEQAGKFVEEHPWETAIGVVLIAGGAYLVVYQGYTLALTVQGVKVASITTGATSGVLVGSGSAVGGAGLIKLAATNDRSRSSAPNSISITATTRPSERPTNVATPLEPPPRVAGPVKYHPRTTSSSDNIDKTGTAARAGDAKSKPVESNKSIMRAPWLRKYPTDMERINFASSVSRWAAENARLSGFDPKSDWTLAEKKLVEAISALEPIASSNDEDELARKQHNSRRNPLSTVIKDQGKHFAIRAAYRLATKQSIADLFTVASRTAALRSTAYSFALYPTATTELMGLEKTRQTLQLQDQLREYLEKRFQPDGKQLPAVRTVEMPPTGPQLRGNP